MRPHRKPAKPYLLGVWVLAAIAALRIFLLIYSWYLLSKLAYAYKGRNFFSVIPIHTILLAFLPALEALVYWLIRYKIKRRWWVHIHVWTCLIGYVILPGILIGLVLKGIMGKIDFPVVNIQVYVFWLLLIIGHAFFIATIVKSFTREKETQSNDEPAGLLDEFIV